MPRSLWSGSLSFGLVNVPVALLSAVQDRDVHFNQLDEKTGQRLHIERYCKEEDVAIPYEEVASGYPRSDGEGYVMLSDLELEAAQPEKTRTIDISEFVDLGDIDPIYFDHPYFLVPNAEGEGALRAYRLLVGVMEKTERVALGRFVMRTKEYLVALRVKGGLLQLVTMHFHDEIRAIEDLPNVPGKKHQPSKAQVDQAVALVEELSCDWDPERYNDRHRDRLRRIIRDKKKGKTIKAPEKPEVPAAVPDLMAALRESLEAARGDGDGDGGGGKKKSGAGKSKAKAKA